MYLTPYCLPVVSSTPTAVSHNKSGEFAWRNWILELLHGKRGFYFRTFLIFTACARKHGTAFGIKIGVCVTVVCLIPVSLKMGEEARSGEEWWRNQFDANLLGNSSSCGNRTSCNSRLEHQAHLRYIRTVTLTIVGFVGLLIVGCLCLCMFYKNERILSNLPWKKRTRHSPNDSEIQKDYFSTIAQMALETGALTEKCYREYVTRQRELSRPARLTSQKRRKGPANSPRQTPVEMQGHHKHRHKPQDDHYLCVPVSGLDGLLSRGSADFREQSHSISGSSEASSYLSDASTLGDGSLYWAQPWTGEPGEPLPFHLKPRSRECSSSGSNSDAYSGMMSYTSPSKASPSSPAQDSQLIEAPLPTLPHEYMASRL